MAPSRPIEADDFPIEDRRPTAQRVRDFCLQLPPRLVDMSATRHQTTLVTFDVCEGAETVPFRFEQPIRVVEGLWQWAKSMG